MTFGINGLNAVLSVSLSTFSCQVAVKKVMSPGLDLGQSILAVCQH